MTASALSRWGLLLSDQLWPADFPTRATHVLCTEITAWSADHHRLVSSYAYAARGEELETRDSLRDQVEREIRDRVARLPLSPEGKPWAVEFFPSDPLRGATVVLDDGLRYVLADPLA